MKKRECINAEIEKSLLILDEIKARMKKCENGYIHELNYFYKEVIGQINELRKELPGY